MATAKKEVTTSTKTLYRLCMGPKEAQALRDVLAREKKGGTSGTSKNLDSIRKALESQGVKRRPRGTNPINGVYTA